MFLVSFYSILLLLLSPGISPANTNNNLLVQQEVLVLTSADQVQSEPVSRPGWSKSVWGNLLFVSLVVAFIFGGAYGIHLYQMRSLHKRASELENVVSFRTQEVERINLAHQDVITALSAANDALLDTNALLESANDKLAWTNSQLSHSNRALELRTAELNFALDQNKEILSITVHDLKNPLGGVLGLSEIIQEDLAHLPIHEKISGIHENLGLVHRTAKQMLLNVENLLDRHGQGLRGPLQKEVVFLNDIIFTTLKWNKQQAKNKCLKIYFTGQQEKVPVRVDVSAIQRVLDNLISNAIKYSSLHSRVWVELLRQEEEVWVSVRDEGPGLTDEDLTRVFGRQQRLSAKPTAGEHSSGYGLYIVKQLIEQHGGQVGVESVLGEGAAFWFKIATAESSQPEEEQLAVVA